MVGRSGLPGSGWRVAQPGARPFTQKGLPSWDFASGREAGCQRLYRLRATFQWENWVRLYPELVELEVQGKDLQITPPGRDSYTKHTGRGSPSPTPP